jgi:hypothetical protein
MFEICEKAKECKEVECYYTKGAFCNLCEERCRMTDTPCILSNFEGFKTIQDKTEKQIELSRTGETFIFYPENPLTSDQLRL